MKKIIFIIISFILLIGITKAEQCQVISGTGKNIGDEISCSGEHFYITSNDGTTVKMLAKYNLLVGYAYENTEDDFTSDTITAANEYCSTTYGSNYYAKKTTDEDSNLYFCYKKEKISTDVVKQDESAIGAHGDEEGNPDNKEIGIISFISYDIYGWDLYDGQEYNQSYYNYDFSGYDYSNPEARNGYYKAKLSYLEDYAETLKQLGIDIVDINLITIDEINDIVKNTSNKELPLEAWAENSWEKIYTNSFFKNPTYKIGSLKDNIDLKYSWL